ncbi:MAG: MFS transporter [Hydrogenibacillus sp.]|nr:MFS transporter [Hydrogenibacillus sp.]
MSGRSPASARQMSGARAPLWTAAFIRVTFANLLHFTAFQLLLPVIPLYAESRGATPEGIGVVIGMLTAFALLIRPFAGAWMDAFGRRAVLFAGLALNAVGIALYNAATDVLALDVVRAVHGIGWGISTTAFGTLAADIVSPARRGEGLGFFGLSSSLAMAIGPFFGDLLYRSISPFALFTVSFGLTLLALFLMLPNRRQTDHPPSPEKQKTALQKARTATAQRNRRTIRSQLFEPTAFWPSFLAMLMSFTYGGVITFLAMYGKQKAIEGVGLFFSVNAVMTIVVRTFSGFVYDRFGALAAVVPGALMGAAGLYALAEAQSLSGVAFAAALYGVAFGAIQPSMQAWAVEVAPENRRGAANAMFFSAFDLGIGGGAFVLGPVARWFGYGEMYRLLALSFLLLAALAFVVRGPRRSREYPPRRA